MNASRLPKQPEGPPTPSQYPEASAAEHRFPQDFPAHALALADATIDRTRGEQGITARRAIAELVLSIEKAVAPAGLGLTAVQAKAFGFIRAYIANYEVAPSLAEIATAMGLTSRSSANRLVKALADRGAITRHPYRARSIQIAERA